MYQICLCNRAEQFQMVSKTDVSFLIDLLEMVGNFYVISTVEKPIAVCIPSDFGWTNDEFKYWRF